MIQELAQQCDERNANPEREEKEERVSITAKLAIDSRSSKAYARYDPCFSLAGTPKYHTQNRWPWNSPPTFPASFFPLSSGSRCGVVRGREIL